MHLTKREIQITGLIVGGSRSREVAEQLEISKRTVDFHIANIYQKLKVNNRMQLCREALSRRLGGAAGR